MDEFPNDTLLNYLDADTRPTFVLEVRHTVKDRDLKPFYHNHALLSKSALLDSVHGQYTDTGSVISWTFTYRNFRTWVIEGGDTSWAAGNYLFKGHMWTRFLVSNRWIVISATEHHDPESPSPSILDDSTPTQRKRKQSRTSVDLTDSTKFDVASTTASIVDGDYLEILAHSLPVSSNTTNLDWTKTDPEHLDDYLKATRNIDWNRTPLGPMKSWSQDLRTMANATMSDPEPAVLFWGKENVMIYNELYVPVVDPKHPECLGTNVLISLPQYNEYLVGIFENIRRTGKTVEMPQIPIFLRNKDGQLEEHFFYSRLYPLLGQSGEVIGIYERNTYITDEVLLRRRLSVLTELPSKMMTAQNLDQFCTITIAALAKNGRDVMAAMLYTMERHRPSQSTKHLGGNHISTNRLILRGSIGIPDNHPIAIDQLDTTQRQSGLMKWFSESQMTGERIILRIEDENLPQHILEGILSPLDETCRSLIICPLRQVITEPIFGWIVFAANPRTNIDDKYLEFVQGVTGLLSTSMASLMNLEEDSVARTPSQENPVLHSASLSQRLPEIELQIPQHERIFHHFVEHSSMGIFIFSPEGQFVYRNRRFNEIYQCENDPNFTVETAMAFYTDPEFVSPVKEKLGAIFQKKEAATLEIRLTKTWKQAASEENSSLAMKDDIARRVWVIASAFPEIGPDGEIVQVLGCVTDISTLKYSNYIQERRTEDAEESKSRLENFIDSTNHELRNPLSAVILAGDDIMNSVFEILDNYPSTTDVPDDMRSLLNNLVENGKTVIQCAKHQKRIVDDILTASKIDSNLVEVCPSEVDPEEEIRSCIKMFDADAQEADVSVTFDRTPEYRALVSTSLIFDPTRFVQVFINLLTNAIKFTRFERTRKVTVLLDAMLEDPRQISNSENLHYIEPRDSLLDPTVGDDWGTGEILFLSLTVKDTGRGLTETEKAVLFARFTQASPRTHVKYGGSGLGLFISRRLSELQGGAIGFTSSPGIGSVFSFYIKVRKTTVSGPHLSRPHSSLSEDRRVLGSPPTSHPFSEIFSHGSTFQTQTIKQISASSPRKLESLTLLVVEDNLINQKMLARQLQKLGCSILVANHGLEAIDQINDTKYGCNKEQDLSVVLLDWEMPIMDGLTCIRRIRELQKNGNFKGHVPVIGVTANARSAQLEQAINAGMDDMVSKPFRLPELMQKITNLLDRFERRGII